MYLNLLIQWGGKMIKNKKLFILTLIVGIIICASLDIPYLLLATKSYTTISLFFIINAIVGATIYTLLFLSLKKVAIVKWIYVGCMALCVIVLILGLGLFLCF